ncbi:MAG: hypothetical protein CFE38_11535 [Comamonadaceae bacterium PBBC1]|nr:MAG: hypothetical protein CFE38_11535 [Comamonadaceae bacterium PBBC1]
MTSTAKANIKAIVKLANGQQSYTLEALSQLKLTAGAQITLIDQVSGKAVTGLLAKRKGNDLVLEREGQGEVASLVDFYSSANVAFYPSGEIPASAMTSSAGAVTAETTTAAVTAAGEPVVWKAPADFGSMGWLAAGGAGLAVAGGGGGAATAAVVVKPAVLLGNFVMGPVLEGSGLVATVYDAAGKVLGVAKIQNDGTFTLTLQQPYTGAVLVVVTDENGTAPDYWDEATGAQKDLTVVLRAMAYINNGQVVNVNVNVFTEAAVRELSVSGSTTLPQGVTAEQIAVANDKVKNALGLVDDLVTGAAPVAVVTNTGASNLTANDYGKLLAAASGVDEAGSTEATIQSLRLAVAAENPVLSTSILLLAGAANVVDKVPSFLTESQMSLSDYFFIADAINALRTDLTGALSLGDLRTIKALSDQLNTLSGALTDLGDVTGVEITALQAALGAPNTATLGDPSNATGLYKTIADAVSTAVLSLQGQIDNQTSLLNDAMALGDKTNADVIAKLVNDAVQGGEPTTGSIAGLKAALTALSGVVDNNNEAQSLALSTAQDALNKAINKVANDLSVKIDNQAILLNDAMALGDKTNADVIAKLVNDAVQGGEPTTGSIAGLKAALTALSGVVNNNNGAQSLALSTAQDALNKAITAVTNDLQGKINALALRIDTNVSSTALILDDTNAVGNTTGNPTTNSIAGLKAALDMLSSAANANLKGLTDRITALEAGLDKAAPAITNIAITATNPDAAGAYGEGDVVRVEVSFGEAVLVKGAPTFALQMGASIVQAVYVSGAGSDKLVFEYTLTASQADVNGISAGVNALRLNEGGAVTDAAGNLAMVTSDVISTALVVVNGPLSLSFTAGAIFGSQFNAGNVVVGVLNPQSFPPTPDNFVFLSDLNGDGYFTVPDGGIFVDADTFVSIFLLRADPSLVVPTFGGERVLFDPSNKLALDYQGLLVVLREDILRAALTFEGVPAVDAYIAANTVPAESVWLYDGASAGETIAQNFLNAIQGRNPADVLLTVTSPLTVAQAAALVQAGFNLTNKVTYALRDYDTTVSAAMLVPGTATVVRGATQVTAIGDELDNAMRFTSFDQRVNLRVEAGAGKDTIDAGRGNDTLVGQAGGDTINLTSADNSFDTVVYQTVNDGQSLPVSSVTFSTNPQDYRPGSVLTVTINGKEYSHTVSTKKGDVLDASTVKAELDAFAAKISALTVPVDNSSAVVAYQVSLLDLINGNGITPLALTVAELDANGSYLVPADHRVMPASSLLLLGGALNSLSGSTLPDAPSSLFTALLFGIGGTGAGQRYTADSSLSLYDTKLIPGNTGGYLVMATPQAIDAYIAATLAAQQAVPTIAPFGSVPDPITAADLLVYSGNVLTAVNTDTGTLRFFGKTGQKLTVQAGGDVEAAIDNNGQVTVVTVDFSSVVADWPTATNGTNTTQFTRKLSVTIDGKTISADLVFDQDGKPNPALSVAALKTAIETANTVGDIKGLLASVNGVTITGAQLTLTGATEPLTDAAAPTFKVDAASVDTNGVQQVSRVAFSTNDADYYQGGKLSVKIAGVDVIADMVAGSATNSVESLLQAIKNKVELVKVIEGVVRDKASLPLTAATEKAAPLLLDATQDYQGEQQQATLQLETGGPDAAYAQYGDGMYTDRGAGVYYQGGKAYVNIRGAGSDGLMGTIDDVSVTVDALMGVDAKTTSQNLVDAINAKVVMGSPVDTPAVFTVAVTGLLERFDMSQSVSVSGSIQIGTGFTKYLGAVNVTTVEGLLGAFAEVDGLVSVKLNAAGDLLTFSTVDTGASVEMKAYIEITSVAAGSRTYYARSSSDFSATTVNGQDATLSIPDPVLSQVLEGAELKDGIITLTAKQYGKETFVISDVTLDYQGVKQLASITLDSSSIPYGSTFIDGKTSDVASYGRGADVYYDGGKAYVTIRGAGVDGLMRTDDDVPVTVSAGMVTSKPATITIDLPNDITGASLLGGLTMSLIAFGATGGKGQDIIVSGMNVDDFINEIANQPFIESATLEGGNIVITAKSLFNKLIIKQDQGLEILIDSTSIFPTGSTLTGEAIVGAQATSKALVDAINAQTVVGGDLEGLIASAAYDSTTGQITLTAKNAGRETFTVSDVTLDYQGQTQQAKATYSTTNADYYAGGTLSLTVDTTPKDLTDTANDVVVTANMVAGSAVDSLSALKAAIDAELQVQQGTEATPTVITVDLGALTPETVNTPPGFLVPVFLVSQWGLLISDGLSTVFIQGGRGSFSGPVWGGENTTFFNLGDFVTYLDGLGEASNAFDAAIESGNLVITSRAKGADVDVQFTLVVKKFGVDFAPTETLFSEAINSTDNNSQTGYTAGSEAVIGSNGRLATVLSEVSVDANGAITLTSKEKTEHAFDISKAEISYPGVKQVSEIVFGGLNDDNFYTTDDAGNQGTVSISIAGTKVTANMGDTEAATLQSLAARIEALRVGVGAVKDDNIAAAVGTVAVIEDKLVLTAAAAGVDPLKVDLASFSITTPEVYGSLHKVTILFSNTTLESAAILGETLSITLDGLTTQLTVNQALLDSVGSSDRSEYLVGKLLDKVIADHTQAGTTNLDLAAAVTARQGNLLSFQASKRGVGLLDVVTASVTINDGAGTSSNSANLEEVAPGVNDTPASTSSKGLTLNDATGEGKAVTGVNADPVAQTITNPGDNSDLFGDSALTGTAGLQQDFVNPGFGQDTLNGVNAGFFGDDPSSQAGEAFALGGAFSQGNAIEVTMFREELWNNTSSIPSFTWLEIVLTFSDGGQSYAFNGFVDTAGAYLGSGVVDRVSGYSPGDDFATAVSKMNDLLSVFEDRVGRELGSITYDALTRKVTMTAVEGVTVSPGDIANLNAKFFDPFYLTFPSENVFLKADGTVQGALQPGESFDASIIVKSLDGGVGQTFTNPGYGFIAPPDSPDNTFGTPPNPGNGDLYGSDPGKYTDTGLNTTSLNGGTVTGTASGNTQIYGYGEPNNPIDLIDLGNGSLPADGGTAGKDAGSLTNSTSEADAFVVKTDTTGFAPFEWKDSVLMVRSTGASVADVVNNFQTAYDFVALEGELLASTVEGDVNGVVVTRTVLDVNIYFLSSDTDGTTPNLVSSGGALLDALAWRVSADYGTPSDLLTSPITLGQNLLLEAQAAGVVSSTASAGTYENLGALLETLNTSGIPKYTLKDNGDHVLLLLDTATAATVSSFPVMVKGLVAFSDVAALDLSTTEFGLVTSVESTLKAAALSSSTDVAAVLNSLFDFDAVLGGTTDNSEINTTVFAVTAADNPNVTAIWAHTQSSTGDNTLEAYELNLLATVNTLGQEFQLANFKPAVPVIPV